MCAALACAVALCAQTLPRPGTSTPAVVLRVPTEVDPSTLTIGYSLGAGYGPLRTSPGVRDYVIETTIGGSPAASFKAWAYSPGFGFALVSLDLAQGPSSRVTTLPFHPLGVVAMTGHVTRTTDTPPLAGLQVEALYSPSFTCEFFMGPKWMDCLTGTIVVASGRIEDDGTFGVSLPDLAHDPSLAPFRDKGTFAFRVMEAPGRPAFGLRSGPPALRLGVMASQDLKVAERYAGTRTFSVPAEPAAIARAQNVLVSDLSAGQPRVSLMDWLLGLVGAATWSIDDCGEQTGNPALDAGRDFPVCITAQAMLPDGRAVLVSVLVGTQQKGVTGEPAFRSSGLVDPRGEPRAFTSLADMADFVRTLPGRAPGNR